MAVAQASQQSTSNESSSAAKAPQLNTTVDQTPLEMDDLSTPSSSKPTATSIATDAQHHSQPSPSASTQHPTASTDAPSASTKVDIALLLSNGNRHAYPIDAEYLRKQDFTVADNDPFNLTVYEVKQLILRAWRDDWESKPSAPNFIRLIFMGSMLHDNDLLKDTRLSKTSANVIHMSVKPEETVEEEADNPKTKAPSGRGSQSANARCNCCVIM